MAQHSPDQPEKLVMISRVFDLAGHRFGSTVHRPRPELERNSSLHTVLARREAEAVLVGSAEVDLVGKPARKGNFRHRQIGLGHKAARPVQTDIAVVKRWRFAHTLRKQPIKLAMG